MKLILNIICFEPMRLPNRSIDQRLALFVLIAIISIGAAARFFVAPAAALDQKDPRPAVATFRTHAAIPPVDNPCPRATAGSVVSNPPALTSQNGLLSVDFSYQTTTDSDGRQLYCLMTPDGLENPTLHIKPGDRLVINITNNTPAASIDMNINPPNCGASAMTASSVNLHFHGANVSPTCTQDEVIRSVINAGETFTYSVLIPVDEAPGLYWYHPHIHGIAEAAVQGGATGAIIVDGIENFQPAVAGLTQQILVMRDQIVAGNPTPGGPVPSWDLTVNTVPIAYPDEVPAIIEMQPGEKQLWRVANTTADSILDLQVIYDGKQQTLQIVALDAVPTGSQDGRLHRGRIVRVKHILIPTAGRAEFIVQGPSSDVTSATLVTQTVDTGPNGDNDPQRTLATIRPPTSSARSSLRAERKLPTVIGPTWQQRFDNLATARRTAKRKLYFSESAGEDSGFFITVDGYIPRLFYANAPPAIVTTQGSVEDWTIENRSLERHEFHIHQIHFLVRSQQHFQINGSVPNPAIVGQFLDTIDVAAWDGNPAHPFPSVTLRMDFRGPDTGDFVYHCHILEHEDGGMMAIIRVMPSVFSATVERARLQLVAMMSWFSGPPNGRNNNTAWCVRGKAIYRRSRPPRSPLIAASKSAESQTVADQASAGSGQT